MKPMEIAQTFTVDLVMRAIKSCINSKAFDPDKPSIFHLKNHSSESYRHSTLPAPDQHGFRSEQSTTSALLQLTDIVMVFNQRKPPDYTVCVTVDLSATFDTVCNNNLLSKINGSQLSPATTRWLSCYIGGRQAKPRPVSEV